MKITRLIVLTLILAAGCGRTKTDDQLVATYADLLLYRQLHSFADSTSLKSGLDSVLTAHSMTRNEFERRFESFRDDPADFRRFNELVQNRISATLLKK